jgi:hypothetical protein
MDKMTGIMFQDITTLLLDPKAFKDTIDLFVERYKGKNISVVAGKKKKKKSFLFVWGKRFGCCGVSISLDQELFRENFLSYCD